MIFATAALAIALLVLLVAWRRDRDRLLADNVAAQARIYALRDEIKATRFTLDTIQTALSMVEKGVAAEQALVAIRFAVDNTASAQTCSSDPEERTAP